ncbi:Altered inheritance of mitochondria 6 protein [Rutstroemia sp. NJR-2017a BVV2]|nr:Altered inheritance of mitochondria 6 protein [Rutstroemia sp. NJR-2017a BVV2]
MVYLSAVLAAVAAASPDVSAALQKILDQAHQGPLYDYPTNWRDVPFYSALSVGCVSVEADVWLVGGELLVGHEQSALTPARTFKSLYIDPILNVLAHQNPNSSYTTTKPTYNGVYDTSSGQTLYLFVDVKTDGPSTWPVVVKQLEGLRSKGYLTSVNETTLISRPVTVVGTGNTPLNLVQPLTSRDYFWDAPIPTLGTTFSNITSLVSPIASTDFLSTIGPILNSNSTATSASDPTNPLNSTQLALLRSQISTAHAKGIKLRYWDQPGWPISTRNAIWKTLVGEGVDLINVDDLEGAAGEW